MTIEITIPVLNEAETLEIQITKILDYLRSSSIKDYGIIIADNGSTDSTGDIGQHLTTIHPQVSYLKVPRKGVGLALQTSWMQSQADIVGYMDLDLATDIKHMEEVYSLFSQNNDIAIVNGSRLLPTSKVIGRSMIREITSRCFNILMKMLLGVKISDGMCGFKFARTNVVKDLINTDITTEGWIFSTELLVKAEWSHKKIVEIPVRWTDDPNSKVKIAKLSWAYFTHLLKLCRQKIAWIRNYGE